jgi:hypothetical protein
MFYSKERNRSRTLSGFDGYSNYMIAFVLFSIIFSYFLVRLSPFLLGVSTFLLEVILLSRDPFLCSLLLTLESLFFSSIDKLVFISLAYVKIRFSFIRGCSSLRLAVSREL